MITSDTKLTNQILTARSKRRSTHVPNLTDELGTAEERRLNNFGRQIRLERQTTISSAGSVALCEWQPIHTAFLSCAELNA